MSAQAFVRADGKKTWEQIEAEILPPGQKLQGTLTSAELQPIIEANGLQSAGRGSRGRFEDCLMRFRAVWVNLHVRLAISVVAGFIWWLPLLCSIQAISFKITSFNFVILSANCLKHFSRPRYKFVRNRAAAKADSKA